MFKNKTILITGGTGSFGQAFIRKLLNKFKFKKIIVFSRDELKQSHMQEELKKYKNLRFFIGDVRDYPRLKFAMDGVDYVVHAAALKQVPTTEYNPFEAVRTNVLGAQNVISAAIDSKVKKVIALSTDKAAAPVNLYGATKLASDKLFISANNLIGKKDIKFSVVRYGNVMGSRGSVVPHFLKCKKNGILPITDPEMTRFNITLDEGVNFVIDSFSRMIGGELFVPKIPSFKITDLAKAIAPSAKIKIIGKRSGEKIHEEMITESDSSNTIEFKKYFIIVPDTKYTYLNKQQYMRVFKRKGAKIVKKGFNYSSKNNKEFLTAKDLKEIIKKNILNDKVR